MGIGSGAGLAYLIAQAALALSVYLSFKLVSNRPLLNAVQVPVFLFYWWFAIGPATIAAALFLFSGDEEAFELYAGSGSSALWIVTVGLPLYALAARLTLGYMGANKVELKSFSPKGENFRRSTIVSLLVVGGLSALVIRLSTGSESGALSQSTYLGGVRTEAWWAGLLLIFPFMGEFGSSAAMHYLAGRNPSDRVLTWIAWMLIPVSLLIAITSGWKGAFFSLLLYLICALTSARQKPPFKFLTATVVAFVFVVEPFVSYGRSLAEIEGVTRSEERTFLFADLAQSPAEFLPKAAAELRVDRLFRGIYPVANRIADEAGPFHGAWNTDTIAWGLEVLIPRALLPEKRDLAIGNYIASTIGVDLRMIAVKDDVTSLSPALPFEFVGNYGWFAGLIAFAACGAVWAALNALVLSVNRLENHPFTPFFAGFALTMEAALGHALSAMRGFFLALFILLLLRQLVGRHL